MYLAIGFYEEDGFTWSCEVDSVDPNVVAHKLYKIGGGVEPDQILLVENGLSSPNVIEHWTYGKHFTL